jgi:hypothetical protein
MMPTEENTEQEQMKPLLAKWKSIDNEMLNLAHQFSFFCLWMMVIALVLLLLNRLFPPLNSVAGIIFIISLMMISVVSEIRRQLSRRWFLRRISEADRTRLEKIALSSNDDSPLAKSLLEACGNHKIRPQDELLRASTPSHDGMLLRPTVTNTETPKEELLWASEEAK